MSEYNPDIGEVDDPSDELGYTEYDWSNLSEAETQRHDEIIGMSENDVLALDLSALTDLQVWAVAQVLGDADNPKSDELTDELIHGKREHPAVDYLGLAVERCYDYVIEDNLDLARGLLAVVRVMSDDDDDIPKSLDAMILYASGEDARSLARYQEIIDEHGDKPEALLNIAGHFSMFDLGDRAEQLLDQAEILARAENDQAMVQLVEEFRTHLREPIDEFIDD